MIGVEDSAQLRWYALKTKPKFEKVASEALRGRGLEDFLPLHRVRRKWSDRMKVVEVPLFPGYLFCRFSWLNRLPVLTVPGITSIVTFACTPTPVPDIEIENIQMVVNSGLAVQPWAFLKVGQKVRIEFGALAGLEGTLVQMKGTCRVVVNVTLLQRGVAVEIDRDQVSAVSQKSRPGPWMAPPEAALHRNAG